MSTFIYIDDLHKGNDKPLFLDEKQGFVISDPGATRTRDQWLKRPLLYQLSYGVKSGNIV